MKTIKRLLLLGLVLIVVASQVSFASFSDVGTDHEYATSIDWMSQNGVIVGYGDGTFGADQCVNRVELLKMLFEMLEVDETQSTYALFPDTPATEWYAPYVRTARERGTVIGYEDGTFRPANCVNRVEAIKMAVLEFNNGTVPSYPEVVYPAQDVEPGSWYVSYLYSSLHSNVLGLIHAQTLTNGYNYFPGNSMSRSEVAEMLYRVKAIHDNNVDVYSDGLVPTNIVGDAVTFHDITNYGNDTAMGSYKQAVLDEYNILFTYKTYVWAEVDPLFEWHGVGTINVEPYRGWELRVLDLQCDGMCFSSSLFRFAYNSSTGELVHLANHSHVNYVPDYIAPLLANTDTTTTLNGLDLPETINFPGSTDVAVRMLKDSKYLPDDLTDVAFVDPVYGEVYYAHVDSNITCLYLMSPDGSVSTYAYEPILLLEGVTMDTGGSTLSISDNYSRNIKGCGLDNCFYIEDVEIGELSLVGTTNSDVGLYEATAPFEGAANDANATSAQILMDEAYQTYVNTFDYNVANEGLTPLNFSEFVADHSLMYFQDPLYRWSAIIKNNAKPPAECGKPVIYLYPEKEMDVHVEVDIDELTVTIPDYGKDGWTVSAQPDGTLYNYADGKEYPYLFWEGHKKDGMLVDQGFMVEKSELKSFLNESLAKMGLNKQESADFMEFWYPRMMENDENYFQVTFVGTRDFNKIAPLTIDPAPDTLLRVFMYYHPTKKPYYVQPQELSGMDRNGFTVVEWGGTSSEPWRK